MGNLKWEYISDGLIDDFDLDPLGKNIVLRGEKFVVFLNRFGATYAVFHHRAEMNSLACSGEYSSSLEI